MRLLLCCLITSALSAALAETPTPVPSPPLIRVQAIAQFVDGHALKTETSGVQTETVYQTPLFDGDRVETSANTTAKFVTRAGCFIVLKGQGSLTAPTEKKSWLARADSIRIICNLSNSSTSTKSIRRARAQSFTIADSATPASTTAALRDGELLFFDKNKVMLLAGAANVLGKPLTLHKLYSTDRGALSEVADPPNESDLRQTNLSERPPRESAPWPEIEKPYTVRIIFGPAFSYDRVFFDNANLNQAKLSGTGPRLQVHVRTKTDRSLIFAAGFNSVEDESRKGSINSTPASGVFNNLDRSIFEFGLRNRHDRWWSPFWRLGAGFLRATVGYGNNTFGYSRYSYEFYVLSAAYGIDAHITPHWLRPFGFYASGEAQLIQSIMRGGRINEQPGSFSFPSIPDEPWRLTELNIGANLGVQYDF